MKYNAKRCLKKGWHMFVVGIEKCTSYERVKSRLGYRWYNDEFLQARIEWEKEEKQPQSIS